jgi:hypothetical protein
MPKKALWFNDTSSSPGGTGISHFFFIWGRGAVREHIKFNVLYVLVGFQMRHEVLWKLRSASTRESFSIVTCIILVNKRHDAQFCTQRCIKGSVRSLCLCCWVDSAGFYT